MKKIIILIFSLFFLIGCSHWLGKSGQHIPGKEGVQIPEDSGEYPKVLAKDILRGQLTPFRSCYNVISYDLSVELNIKEKFWDIVKQRQSL